MDFKLAGTTKGITGFQLDLKINGLPFEIAKAAIHQARDARVEILKTMLASLPAPRADLSKYAPRIQTIQIDPEKIGLLIGPGGKTIRRITETTGAQIDIAEDDSGKVFIYSNNADAMNRAIKEIDGLCGGGGRRRRRWRRTDRSRQDLHRSRHRHQGFRLLRRVHARQGRPRPHQRTRRFPRAPHRGRRQDGRLDHGEVHRHRRAIRQGPPLAQSRDEGTRRSGSTSPPLSLPPPNNRRNGQFTTRVESKFEPERSCAPAFSCPDPFDGNDSPVSSSPRFSSRIVGSQQLSRVNLHVLASVSASATVQRSPDSLGCLFVSIRNP